MSALSCGPWTYNRFNQYEELLEGKKPDFLDVDKDGDEKESFKKAVKDKKEGEKCDKCDGKHDTKDHDEKESSSDDKKSKKEKVTEQLIADGLANNAVSAEIIEAHMSEAWRNAILESLA